MRGGANRQRNCLQHYHKINFTYCAAENRVSAFFVFTTTAELHKKNVATAVAFHHFIWILCCSILAFNVQ